MHYEIECIPSLAFSSKAIFDSRTIEYTRVESVEARR